MPIKRADNFELIKHLTELAISKKIKIDKTDDVQYRALGSNEITTYSIELYFYFSCPYYEILTFLKDFEFGKTPN